MDNTWSPGERADAHHVSGVLREKFARDEKRSSREFVADYFASVGATSVLDLWGGGESALALRAALPDARIVSVENGSVCESEWFVDRLGRRVSKDRLRRAHRVAAEEGGYEAAWGDVSRHMDGMDAIWLDFCAQWHPRMGELVARAGASTSHLAITIMPERDGLGSLGLHDRMMALACVVAAHSGMVPSYVGSYRRNEYGQDMVVLVLRAKVAVGRSDSDQREVVAFWPEQVLRHLVWKGHWISKSFARTKSRALGKCSRCRVSFTFDPSKRQSSRRLCSSCRTYQPRNIGKPCENCGSPMGLGRQRYCSDSCHADAPERRAADKPPCRVCGTQIPLGRRSFCSDRCKRSVDHMERRGTRGVPCRLCGQPFDRVKYGQRNFCSTECRLASGGSPSEWPNRVTLDPVAA